MVRRRAAESRRRRKLSETEKKKKITSSSLPEREMEYRCVECGYKIGVNKPLFIQYSPGNIRLIKCVNCKSVADQYIECETMILLIDVILHKPKAYRHLLYNLLNQQLVNFQGLFWKSMLAFLLLDGYMIMVYEWTEGNLDSQMNFSALLWRCGKMLTDLLLGNFLFVCSLFFLTRFFCDPVMGVSRFKEILFTIFVSSYFKIFLIAMMLWEFPSSVLLITDIFVLSSNTVAFQVITEASVDKCIGACLSAHAVRFSVRWLLSMITSPSSLYTHHFHWENLVSGFWPNHSIELGKLSPS